MNKPAHDIDLNRVKNKQVVSFIHDNGLYQLQDFAELQSFSRSHPDIDAFHHHSKTFHIQKPVDEVWEAYKNIHPKKAWCGKMLQFGLQYCRKQNKLAYIDDEYKGASVGQIVLIRVKVLGGLARIAVGHEITAVNEEEKYLETSYLLKGKSLGSQRIRLSTCKEGFTNITHHTIYKSKSRFRDKYLYPILHTKAISEFHGNIKRHLTRSL